MHRATAELRASGAAKRANKVGDEAPAFTLKGPEAVPADATSEAAVAALFARAFAPSEIHDAPDLVVFNGGAHQLMKFLALEAHQFENFWRVGCFAGFLASW